MVSVRENRSDAVLVPVAPLEPGPQQGWRQGRVRVDAVDSVGDWPNLLADAQGRTMTALLPPDVAGALADADRWRVRVALVRPNVVRIQDVHRRPA